MKPNCSNKKFSKQDVQYCIVSFPKLLRQSVQKWKYTVIQELLAETGDIL